MLICHELVVSNEAAVLQACCMADVHETSALRAFGCVWQSRCSRSVYHARVVRSCVPLNASPSLIYHFWFLKHHHSAATHNYYRRWEMQLSYPWKLHACRANNYCFLYIYFYFLLYVFGIVFNCIIRNNSYCLYLHFFLYNYLWQMHQIIHLSPGGCFTPARGKTVRKNCEVSGVNDGPCALFKKMCAKSEALLININPSALLKMWTKGRN